MREFENWEKLNILDIIGNFWDNIGYLILHKPVESLASDVSLTRVWSHWQEMMMCTLGDLRVLKNFVNRWDWTWPAKFKEQPCCWQRQKPESLLLLLLIETQREWKHKYSAIRNNDDDSGDDAFVPVVVRLGACYSLTFSDRRPWAD